MQTDQSGCDAVQSCDTFGDIEKYSAVLIE